MNVRHLVGLAMVLAVGAISASAHTALAMQEGGAGLGASSGWSSQRDQQLGGYQDWASQLAGWFSRTFESEAARQSRERYNSLMGRSDALDRRSLGILDNTPNGQRGYGNSQTDPNDKGF